MPQNFGNAFNNKPPSRDNPAPPKPAVRSGTGGRASAAPKPVYAKVFRWQLPEGRTQEPATVEIVGTFSNWQRVPLVYDRKQHVWHLTIHHVPAHKMHHYMLLVDGQPAHDKNSDGLAVPHGPQEQHYQLMTDRGPRLFMLFAQSK